MQYHDRIRHQKAHLFDSDMMGFCKHVKCAATAFCS